MSIVSALYEPPPLYTCCGLLSLGSGMLGPARERGFSQPVVLREPWADFAYRISFLNGASGRRHLLHTCAAVLRAHHLLHHAGRRGLVRDEAEGACLKSLTRQLSGPGPAGFVSVHSEPSGGWSRPLTGIVSNFSQTAWSKRKGMKGKWRAVLYGLARLGRHSRGQLMRVSCCLKRSVPER